MPQFWTDYVVVCCSNVEAAKRWWIEAFNCTPTKAPADWDNPFPSDIALKLPQDETPHILLTDRAERNAEGETRQATDHPIMFSNNLKKAYEHFRGKGFAPGAIQDGGGTQFFEIRDPDGNVIEICEEP